MTRVADCATQCDLLPESRNVAEELRCLSSAAVAAATRGLHRINRRIALLASSSTAPTTVEPDDGTFDDSLGWVRVANDAPPRLPPLCPTLLVVHSPAASRHAATASSTTTNTHTATATVQASEGRDTTTTSSSASSGTPPSDAAKLRPPPLTSMHSVASCCSLGSWSMVYTPRTPLSAAQCTAAMPQAAPASEPGALSPGAASQSQSVSFSSRGASRLGHPFTEGACDQGALRCRGGAASDGNCEVTASLFPSPLSSPARPVSLLKRSIAVEPFLSSSAASSIPSPTLNPPSPNVPLLVAERVGLCSDVDAVAGDDAVEHDQRGSIFISHMNHMVQRLLLPCTRLCVRHLLRFVSMPGGAPAANPSSDAGSSVRRGEREGEGTPFWSPLATAVELLVHWDPIGAAVSWAYGATMRWCIPDSGPRGRLASASTPPIVV